MLRRYLSFSHAALVGPFRALWYERDLVRLLIRRDIAVRTSGTWLGGVWMLAQPALQILALWFLLDFVLRVKFAGKVAFLDYFLVGMLPWLMISEILNRCLSVMGEFSSLYARSRFPLILLPLMPLLVSGAVYGTVYLFVVLVLEGPLAALLVPLLWCGLLLWLLPFCYILAVGGLFLRDAAQVVPFLLTMMMYLTPILYMPEMLPESVRAWFVLNPFADIMALAHALLQGLSWNIGNLLRPLLLWLLVLAPAWVLFHRTQPHMREAL